MSYVLYDNPVSPFCRKVRLILSEAGWTDRVELISVAGTAVDTGSMPLSVNPLGKIPCLVRPDGPALYDSRVICRYLDAHSAAGLYPSGAAHWSALTLEATADGIMDAAVLIVYEGRTRPAELQSTDWVEGQKAKIARAFAALESRWMADLEGPVGIGPLSVGAAIGYVEFRLPDWDWRPNYPSLSTWYSKFLERPSMQATRPE